MAAGLSPSTNMVGTRPGVSGASAVDSSTYSSWVGTADNTQRYDNGSQDSNFSGGQQGSSGQQSNFWTLTPLVARGAMAFQTTEAFQDSLASSTAGKAFRPAIKSDVVRGVGIYDHNISLLSSDMVKPGALVNRAY